MSRADEAGSSAGPDEAVSASQGSRPQTEPPLAGTVAPGRRRLTALVVGAALLVPLLLAIVSSVRDERARRTELSGLRPLVSLATGAGRALTARSRVVVEATSGIAAAVLSAVAIFGLARRRKEGLASALALFACALAALGQARFVLGRLQPGIGLYGGALLAFGVSLVLSRKDPTPYAPGARISPRAAAAALVVIAWTGLLYRFYALGQFPPDFDGEETFYMASATTLYGAAQVTFGTEGPWSPLGWLYYLLVFFFTRTCGTTLLSIRFVSAVIGFFAIPLFYGFLRRLAGTLEAVLGTILLCFGLTEILWSRTDDYPLHLPGFVAIALAWATYEAITTERLRAFAVVAVLMGLSYHQYPSGQTSFLIPVGAVLGRSIFGRGFLRRSWKGVLLVFLGIALWAVGLGINGLLAGTRFVWRNPFALNQGKTLWSVPLERPGSLARAKFLAESAVRGVGIIARTEFFDVVPSDFPHHENVPPVDGLSKRHISAPVAVMLALGLASLLLRPTSPGSLVLLTWLVAGSLPGLLSTFPSSRRVATLFPAFMAVAALGGGLILRSAAKLLGERGGRVFTATALGALFGGLGAVTGFLYMGPRTSTIRAVAAADAIRPYLKPRTLALFEADYGEYTAIEVTYLLLDHLNTGPRPAIWRIAQPTDWPTIGFRPTPSPTSWIYKFSMLRGRAAALVKDPSFDRVTFIVQDTEARKLNRDLLAQIYPGHRMEHLHLAEGNDQFNFVVLTVDAATVKDNQRPSVTVPAWGAAAAGPAEWWQGVEVRLTRDGAPSAPAVLRAGLWLPDQRWISLRFRGAGDGAKLVLDGVPSPEGKSRPLARGTHRLELTLGSRPTLPLRLEASADGRDFQPFTEAVVTSPRLAELPALRAGEVLLYPGFDPPEPVADIDSAFLYDLAVSADGSIAAVRTLRDEWRLEVYPPAAAPRVWSVRRPSGEMQVAPSVSFVGRGDIAMVSWPHLFVFSPVGVLRREIDLSPFTTTAEDLGANEDGEFFLACGDRHAVLVLSSSGEPTATLRPREGGSDWVPLSLSVPFRGPIAVRDGAERITVFERGPSGWNEEGTSPSTPGVDQSRFTMSPDGWLFVQDVRTNEWTVRDREGRRRVPADRLHEVSRFPTERFIGFDRRGRLFVASGGKVSRFVPVTDAEAPGR